MGTWVKISEKQITQNGEADEPTNIVLFCSQAPVIHHFLASPPWSTIWPPLQARLLCLEYCSCACVCGKVPRQQCFLCLAIHVVIHIHIVQLKF